MTLIMFNLLMGPVALDGGRAEGGALQVEREVVLVLQGAVAALKGEVEPLQEQRDAEHHLGEPQTRAQAAAGAGAEGQPAEARGGSAEARVLDPPG